MTTRTFARSACLVFTAALLMGCVAYEVSAPPPPSRPVAPPPPPRPGIGVDIGFFYDALDPDGDWLQVEPYGWVWVPDTVDPFWRPYTVGHWEWTDWGWTWVAAERWGWATYHYGRWARLNHHGWAWIPGDVWGPAWVAWRSGPGVVGWAPLPPEVRFRAGVGLDWGGIDIDVAIHLDQWCFVDDTRFADNDVHRYAYPVGRNTTAIRNTRDATRLAVRDGKIVNEGIDRGELERVTHRAIPARRIIDNPGADRRRAEVTTEEIRVYRPEVRPGPPEAAPPRGRKPSEPVRPSADPKIEDKAVRRWDREWNKDWDKLEKLQKRDEPAAASPAKAPPRPGNLQQVRDENMDAAENAYRELVAERQRAKRQAERAPGAANPKKDEKGGEKKDKQDKQH
jgi:uncharacterized protein DUF6600